MPPVQQMHQHVLLVLPIIIDQRQQHVNYVIQFMQNVPHVPKQLKHVPHVQRIII